MKKYLLLALKVGITGALLWMIFREHHFGVIVNQLAESLHTRWHWVLAGLASVGASTWLSALRWQVLLTGQRCPVPAREVLRITLVSNFFNITSLGAAGGDAYRVLALVGRPGLRRVSILVSVLLDHLLGMFALAGMFFAATAAYRGRWDAFGAEVKALVDGFSMFMGGSIVFVILSAISFTPGLYAWGEKRWPWMLGWPPLKQFAQACDGMRRAWGCSLVAIVLSVLIFLTHFLSFYFAVLAVGGDAGLKEIFAAMPIVDAVAGLPISVSGLGVREKTFETLVHALSGVPEATAVSASLAGWLMGVVWGLLGGLLFVRGGSAIPARTRPAPKPEPTA
jgi:uncharacterized membrane protein YbhN (UPF0104 family)